MTKLELLLIVHTTRADLTQVKVGTATAYRTPKSNSVKLAEGGMYRTYVRYSEREISERLESSSPFNFKVASNTTSSQYYLHR